MLLAYLPSLLAGAATTLAVAALSLVLAVLLGLAAARARLSRSRASRAVATAYVTLIRGVPDLVLMLLLFYGGQRALNAVLSAFSDGAYVDLDPFIAGTLTIGFVYGAYLGETFRGAFLAVPEGAIEAAHAVGLSARQVFTRVQGPLMLRHALPALSNNWLVMLKSTAIVSVIGLPDLMQRAGNAASSTRQPFLFYGAAAAMYLVVTAASELAFRRVDARLQVGVRPVER